MLILEMEIVWAWLCGWQGFNIADKMFAEFFISLQSMH